MPQLLLRSIITGFGYKLGAELGRYVIERWGRKRAAAEADNMPDETGDAAEPPVGAPVSPPARPEREPSTAAS